jgi:CBS domain containing-hemolysin-like protein
LSLSILFIFVSLLFSAFFSGLEIAFISANKLRIELDKKRGSYGSKIVSLLTKNPGQYITTMLVGNNAALVIYGYLMAIELTPIILALHITSEIAILIIQTLISTLIILVTAEFLPKTLFRINPNKILNVFSLPVMIIYVLLYPVAKITMLFSSVILQIFFTAKINNKQEQVVFSAIDLDHIIAQSKDENKDENEIEHDIKLFQNALDFSKVKLRECIIPRNEIIALELNSPVEKLKEKFIETGFSKILIYKEGIDNIIGYVQSTDLFHNPNNISSMLKSLVIVPETMTASKLFNSFMKEHKSIALVVDEFGGTSGIVTIEDIIEEIFGEIEDEHDSSDLEEEQVSNTEFIFSGRLEIDYVNEKYNLNIPEEEEFETIAGYILQYHEEIPIEGEKITIDNFEFDILKMQGPKIELIKINQLSKND